jgi:hypothetical protein
MRNFIFTLVCLFSIEAFAGGVNWGDHASLLDPVPVASVTSSGNGTDLDLQQYSGQIVILADMKNTAGSSPTMDISVNDSADNSTFAALSPAVAFTQMTTGASAFKLVLNKDNIRRYLRIVKTIGGTNTPTFLTSVKILAVKKYPQ